MNFNKKSKIKFILNDILSILLRFSSVLKEKKIIAIEWFVELIIEIFSKSFNHSSKEKLIIKLIIL